MKGVALLVVGLLAAALIPAALAGEVDKDLEFEINKVLEGDRTVDVKVELAKEVTDDSKSRSLKFELTADGGLTHEEFMMIHKGIGEKVAAFDPHLMDDPAFMKLHDALHASGIMCEGNELMEDSKLEINVEFMKEKDLEDMEVDKELTAEIKKQIGDVTKEFSFDLDDAPEMKMDMDDDELDD